MAQMVEAGIVENKKMDKYPQIIGVHQIQEKMLGVQVVFKDKARKQQIMLGVHKHKRKLLKPLIPQMDGEVQKQRLRQQVHGVRVKLKLMMLLNQAGVRVSLLLQHNRSPLVGVPRIKPKEVGDLRKKQKY